MKKYERFTQQELESICKESESYREVATKVGYSPNGGSGIKAVQEMIKKYNFDIDFDKSQQYYIKAVAKRDIHEGHKRESFYIPLEGI